MNFWIPWILVLLGWAFGFFVVPWATRRVLARSRATRALAWPNDKDDLGRVPAHRIRYLKAEFIRDDEMEAADFISQLDAMIRWPYDALYRIGDGPYTKADDVRVVAASAAVSGQSSAAVLGSQDLAKYAQRLREAGGHPFAGTAYQPFQPGPNGGCLCTLCAAGRQHA